MSRFMRMTMIAAVATGSVWQRALAVRDVLTYQDYLDVNSIIIQAIEDSTCPFDRAELQSHWDFDGEDDCRLFPRIRNPDPLGTRLVRHAFHDAAVVGGGQHYVDGHVDLNNKDNDGLESSAEVLQTLYDTQQLPTSGEAVKDVMTLADFSAWSYISALQYAAAKQTKTSRVDDTDYIPQIPLFYGRPEYDAADPPAEVLPPLGGHTDLTSLTRFFHDLFGFNARETVVLMGAHTLGGARREESGFAGMWTQSKNEFNNAYYSNMIDPLPLDCGDAKNGQGGGIDSCIKLREAQMCDTAGAGNRCLGWELRRMAAVQVEGEPRKPPSFQWRHSCDGNGDHCHHLMLNVDMALYRDISPYLCSQDDVMGGEDCDVGSIKAYPADRPDCPYLDPQTGNVRALASCFALVPPQPEEDTASLVQDFSETANQNSWIDEFAVVFSHMINGNGPSPRMTQLKQVSVDDLLQDNEVCPWNAQIGCLLGARQRENPIDCAACASGKCANLGGDNTFCKGADWAPAKLKRKKDCSTYMNDPFEGCLRPDNADGFDCFHCKTGYCAVNAKIQRQTGQDVYQCAKNKTKKKKKQKGTTN